MNTTEPAEGPTNFLSLPRELRDQIYGYLLRGTSRGEVASAAAKAHTRKRISGRLAILHTSKNVREEALEILHEQGTFRFVLAPPGNDTISQKIKNQMQNIDITIILFSFRPKLAQVGEAILRSFHGVDVKRKSCVIEVRYREDEEIVRPSFLSAVKGLTGFEHITFKMVCVKPILISGGIAVWAADPAQSCPVRFNDWSISTFRFLVDMLEGALGDGKGFIDD
ncbi:hypothetical protein OEA41_009051 [Lepraria neglecta]|uniref:Uncharacterized protein n=1 Tax=Lepraria neglecta TaxID=209136 RepID=A0AAD9Z3I9_9LECA|nr:hypothetical protein OEA41_009051 [Lepraria neglecta]